jgi:ATP-dependent DNA ligase
MKDLKPQKALHLYTDLDKKKPKSTGHEYMVTEKKDGWYGYYDSTDGHIRSRAMRIIPSLEMVSRHLKSQVQDIVELRGQFRIIFEITHATVEDFYTLNGMLNSHAVLDPSEIVLYAHDLLLEDNPTETASERYNNLYHLASKYSPSCVWDTPVLEVANLITTTKYQDTWQALAETVWASGGEGVILKRADSVYESGKRNANLLKIKEEVTLDLLVIGVTEGKDAFSGMVGALIVRDKSGREHHVSGMSIAQREQWWACQLDIVGSIVEVKAMKVNKDGSLREARFKSIRHDLTIADLD